MISILIMVVLKRLDDEIDLRISKKIVYLSIMSEILIFILLYIPYIDLKKDKYDNGQTFIVIYMSVYWTLTAVIDGLTGYVYKLINISFFTIVFLMKIQSGNLLDDFFRMCLFGIFIDLLEKLKAFSKGDSEFLIVTYFLMESIFIVSFVFDNILTAMLLSFIIFDIFRKAIKRKEGMMPFTPFIVLSEIINLFIYAILRH